MSGCRQGGTNGPFARRPPPGDRVELFLILDLARGSFQRYIRCIGYLGLDREKRQNQQAFSRPFSSTTPTANLM